MLDQILGKLSGDVSSCTRGSMASSLSETDLTEEELNEIISSVPDLDMSTYKGYVSGVMDDSKKEVASMVS